MMTLRVALTVVLALDLLAAPLVGEGQPAPTVYRIGVLDPTSSTVTSGVDGLRVGLQDLGDVEGKNVVIESRLAAGKYDRLPDLAAELVRVNADVLVTFGTAATLAAKAATTTIPIVMLNTGDAVATGLVANLARPQPLLLRADRVIE